MAHALSVKNGRASMAFVGTTPWHGLGQSLALGASIEEWTREAGFAWQALSAPVQFTDSEGNLHRMPSKQVIYRSDSGAPLSVMGDGYNIVQPRECLEFFRSLVESQGFQLETAGVLFGGRKLWALAKNGHSGEVVAGDVVDQYLLMSTSLDGTSPTTAAFTAVRVVCANTLRMAADTLSNDKSKTSRTSHRSLFDADAAKSQLGLSDSLWDTYLSSMRALAGQSCDVEEARELLRSLFGQPIKSKAGKAAEAAQTAQVPALAATVAPAEAESFAALMARPMLIVPDAIAEARQDLARMFAGAGANEREQKSVARTLALFAGEGKGSTAEGVAGTRWGLLNAITEHVDHEQGRTRDAGLNAAWFGKGDDAKQSALALLMN